MFKGSFHRGWRVPRFFIFFLLAVLAFGLIIMLLWNWLMPLLFNLPEISYFQSLGLLLLSKILFGFHGRHNRWHYHRERCEQWRKKYEEMHGKTGETA